MAQAKRLLGFGAAPANANVKNKTSPQALPQHTPPTKLRLLSQLNAQVKSTADPKPVLEPQTCSQRHQFNQTPALNLSSQHQSG